MYNLEQYLVEITGMDAVSLQPVAGAHGEHTGLKIIAAYHKARGDHKRTTVLVPDSAHGTNRQRGYGGHEDCGNQVGLPWLRSAWRTLRPRSTIPWPP